MCSRAALLLLSASLTPTTTAGSSLRAGRDSAPPRASSAAASAYPSFVPAFSANTSYEQNIGRVIDRVPGVVYFSVAQQATSFDVFSAHDGRWSSRVVSLFGSANMECTVNSASFCTSYCPLAGAWPPARGERPPPRRPSARLWLTPTLRSSPRPLPAGPLYPLSVEGFLDEGPEYASGRLLEKWVTALPPDSPFPFVRELKLVNQADFTNATLAYNGYTVDLPPFSDLFGFSTNYTGTRVGEPAASIFVVHGMSSCPLALNCEDSVERLASRAATGRPWPKVLPDAR